MSDTLTRLNIRLFIRRWVYPILIAIVSAAITYHYTRGPRRLPQPTVIIPKLPAIASRMVTIDSQTRTVYEWITEFSRQSKVPVEFTNGFAMKLEAEGIEPTWKFALQATEPRPLAGAMASLTKLPQSLYVEYAEDRIYVGVNDDPENAARAETRIYPIGDLLEDPSPILTATSHIGRINQLKDLIYSICNPDSWRLQGGNTGTIFDMGDRLIINQTPGTQWEIQQLLNALRKTP